MCGIVGFSTSEQIFDSSVLVDALCKLRHRGPDAEGTWINDDATVGLGHTRLSILDLSDSASQPMLYDNRYTLIYNGEIYNYEQLRQELILLGYKFESTGDTEVVLKWFVEFGTRGFSRFNGIFALAIWDNETKTLILARDKMGVKPMYYTESDGKFAFASEIKALSNFIIWDWEVDVSALVNYVSFIYNPAITTPNSSVKKLKPGEILFIRGGKVARSMTTESRLRSYRDYPEKDKNYYISGVREHLSNAVSRQMISDVEVGGFLSGGLDSSAICYFAKNLQKDLQCFTISSNMDQEPGSVSDLPYAKQMADYLGVKLHIFETTSDSLTKGLEDMVYQLDEPLADPAALNVYLISQFARKMGIKVLLSGAGGDDLFTGYRRHQALESEKFWDWLPLSSRKLFNITLNKYPSLSGLRRLRKLVAASMLDPKLRLVEYHLWASGDLLRSLFRDEFREHVLNDIIAEPMLSHLNELPPRLDRMEQLLSLEKRFFLAEHNLTYTDKMSMAAGVEVRVPFLDNDLVDFAQEIPTRYKQFLFEGKWVLKKAMESYLPKSLIYRPKTGFGVPLRSWMQNELSEMKNDLLSEQTVKSRGIFKHKNVTKLINDTASGKIDGSYTLLSLMCIEIWLRKFSDSN